MTGAGDEADILKREAYAFVARLTSGEATPADAAALARWRATSPAHARAFAEAKLLWKVMGPAAQRAVADTAATPAATAGFSRRAMVGGALAASAAGAAYAIAWPPLGLWPSFAELDSDYRTRTGEQKQIAFGHGVSVELNTRTSIALRSNSAAPDRIELISGEAAVTADMAQVASFMVVAGDGRAIARQAKFDIRYLGAAVCVTCTDGEVTVEQRSAKATLQPHQQVSYSSEGLGQITPVDAATVTSWQRGLLVFRQTPLAEVIEEINRYRAGRIILVNQGVSQRLVFATFRIDRINEVVPRLQAAFGLNARDLPGGIVLLG